MHFLTHRMSIFATLIAITWSVAGCEAPNADEQVPEEQAQQHRELTPREQASVVKVDLTTVGNERRFEQEEIRVPAGSTIHLTLANPATDPDLHHNWVLTELNRADDVGRAGALAGPENDHVPEHTAVIAHTPLVAPGQVGEVIFEAPPRGTYSFVCTFPGHFQTMQGRFIVE